MKKSHLLLVVLLISGLAAFTLVYFRSSEQPPTLEPMTSFGQVQTDDFNEPELEKETEAGLTETETDQPAGNITANTESSASNSPITNKDEPRPINNQPSPQPAPIPATPPPTPSSAAHKTAFTTFFWVGEPADSSNGFIANDKSAWDGKWKENFGGFDDPNDRCGHHPCAFTPKQNPFYFALPYSDLDSRGRRKASAELIPWFESRKHLRSVVKNAWIEVKYGSKVCYAQWEDVGPYETDDFDYVFGTAAPKNKAGLKAGLDLSPAVRDCLGMKTNGNTMWKFIESSQVPAGPWKEIVTAG